MRHPPNSPRSTSNPSQCRSLFPLPHYLVEFAPEALNDLGDNQFVFMWYLVVSDEEQVDSCTSESEVERIERGGELQVEEVSSVVCVILLEILAPETLVEHIVG
jgi:hypothetical protein